MKAEESSTDATTPPTNDAPGGEEPTGEAPASGPSEPQAGEAQADELRRLRAERDQMSDQLLRSLADFDNYRKRAQREQGEQRLLGMIEAFRAVLPALDGVERALAIQGGSIEDVRKGLELVHRQLLDSVRKIGVEPIETIGKAFDPHFQEAVEMVPTTEAPDHTVLGELQRGYKLRGKLVRPAMVRVAQNPSERNGEA